MSDCIESYKKTQKDIDENINKKAKVVEIRTNCKGTSDTATQTEEKKKCVTITPTIELLSKSGWVDKNDEKYFVTATIMIGIKEEPSNGDYRGKGLLTASSSLGEFFKDKDCKQPADTEYEIAALRKTPTIYVKGNNVGGENIKLALEITGNNIKVQGPATADLQFNAVNVITPKIEAESNVILVGNPIPIQGKKTSLSKIELSFNQTNPEHPCKDLKAKLILEDSITCFRDENGDSEYNSGTLLKYEDLTKSEPFKLYVTSKNEGNYNLTLEGVIPKNIETDKSFRVHPKSGDTVTAVRLIIEASLYLEGWTYEHHKNKDDILKPPKKSDPGRWLHVHDGKDTFKLARIKIKQPNQLIWEKGGDETEITLSSKAPQNPAVFYKNEGGTQKAKSKLGKGDLETTDKVLWIMGKGDYDLEPEPRQMDFSQIKNPEKVIETCHIHTGISVPSRKSSSQKIRLEHGDGLKLDVYSFDRYLDRKTMNQAYQKISPNSDNYDLSKKDVAVACAGFHCTDDTLSTFHFNRNYGISDPFGQFVNKLYWGNHDSKEKDTSKRKNEVIENTVEFICSKILLGITVNTNIKSMIKEYIKKTWKYGQVKYGYNNFILEGEGFSRRWGVPGVHAEVLAVNELLNMYDKKMTQDSTVNDLDKITVATYRLQKDINGNQGRRFKACPNCSGILNRDGLRIITDP